MNCYEWDGFLGDKPDGFDDMSVQEKHPILRPIMDKIENILGDAGTNRAWWIYYLKKTEDEWLHWYVNHDNIDDETSD